MSTERLNSLSILYESLNQVEDTIVEVPFTKIVEVPVIEHVEIPVERLVSETVYRDDTVEIPLTQEVVKEVVEDVYKEKVFHLVKEVYKPKFIPKYVDKYIDKYVDVIEYVPNLKFVEIYSEKNIDKPCEVTTSIQRLNVKGLNIPKPMNTYIKREVLSEAQKRRFDESSRNLAKAIEDNVKAKAALDGLNNLHRAGSHTINQRVTDQMVNQMRNQIQNMEMSLRTKEEEASRLRHQLSQEKQIEQVVSHDREMIPILQQQIRNIKEHNAYLRDLARQGQFFEEVVEVGSEVVGHQVSGGVNHPTTRVSQLAPHSRSESYYSGSYSSRSSRSVSPSPVLAHSAYPVIHPTSRVLNQSPRHTQPVPRLTTTHNTAYPNAVRRSSPAPQRVVAASPRVISGHIPATGPIQNRVQSRPMRSRSSSVYSSGGSYSSYSSRSPSPVPIRHHSGLANRVPQRSTYQSQVDSVVAPYSRHNGPTPVRAINNDFGTSIRSTNQSYVGGKPFSTASTIGPNTIQNTGRLIGDYSMAQRSNWRS